MGRATNWLTFAGAVTAFTIGSLILLGTGLVGGALVTMFFVTGSLLTFGRSRPTQSGGRTAMQVAANGAWAAVGATIVAMGSVIGWPIMIGSLAGAQADTWATEIGGRSRRQPRLITGGQVVQPGTSGGVTWLGSLGGILGAVLIGLATVPFGQTWPVAVAGVIGGVAGMLADSFAGAVHQAKYRCAICHAIVDERIHCEVPATFEGGKRWLTNNGVNVVGSGTGALVAALLTILWTSVLR